MLSQLQQQKLVAKLNEEIDIPLMSEGHEGRIIAKLVEKADRKLEPALRACVPEDYVNLIKIFLSDTIPPDDKRVQIAEILQRNLGPPITEYLNQTNDVPMIPEELEQKGIAKIVDMIIKETSEHAISDNPVW
eukprot:EC123747.1.p1 GENE.EC123747.1~~EC123747.1.p1  ORF type:complete len:133 (+),score=19.90 EC123747.1:125-523(+)